MGRRQTAFKEVVLLPLLVFLWIVTTMIVLVATMILLIPTSIIWLIRPTFGDRLLDRLATPLCFLLSPPNIL